MNYLMAVLLLLMTVTPGWAQEGSSVRITQIDGTVEILKSGAKDLRSAKEGDVLNRGDRLVSQNRSAALLLWSNGSMVKVYPNTNITLTGVVFDLEKKMEKTIFELEKGRMFIKAQVPDNLFNEFKVRMGPLILRSQGAEFAIKYNPDKKSYTAWSLLGPLLAEVGTKYARIKEGHRGRISEKTQLGKEGFTAISDKVRKSLLKASKKMGGSMLMEEEIADTGGKLIAKIGGLTSRRGGVPFTVNFKARVRGGSGKIKSVKWDFGDGETATTKEAEHIFTQGLYVVILRVEDENGEKASAQTGISAEAECQC